MRRIRVRPLIGLAALIALGVIALEHDKKSGVVPPPPPPAAARTAPEASPPPPRTETVAPPAEPEATVPPPAAVEPPKTAPSFDVVRVTPAGEAVIAGRAAPGAEVTVVEGDKTVATVTADKRGEWVAVPATPLAPGARELDLSAKTDETAPPATAKEKVVVVVPEPAVKAPPVAVAVAPDGNATKLLQAPAPESDTPPAGNVGVNSLNYDERGSVSVGGTAEPGKPVQVYVDDKPVGRAETDDKGRWTVTPEAPIQAGEHKLRADQVDDGGKVASRVELPVEIASAPPPPGKNAVVVQPGNCLWRIALRAYGDGYKYIQIYRSNRSQIRDPDLIYPGQVFELPKAP